MTDHLARLCFDGAGSTGDYTPHAFNLRLGGVRMSADHVVYLHEVHHAALNDVTAWGSALHVYARLPAGTGQQFGPLLDACRTTHESLATFASVQIASARHGALDDVLAVYPRYVPLYAAAAKLFAAVPGSSRRQLAASALARLCMQTPVLERIVTTGLDAFRLAAVRSRDTPDGRWGWFLRQGPQLPAAAAAAADDAVVGEFGRAALDSDGPGGDLYRSTDRSHDEAWDLWEASAYQALRAALAATGAETLGFNGHQDGTAALVELAVARYGDLHLRAAMAEEQRHDDAALASSVLQQVRHQFSGDKPYEAVLIPPADRAQVAEILSEIPVTGGRPAMVIDARPVSRLAALYRWPDGALPAQLRTPGGPVVALRLIVDDSGPDGAIGHVPIPAPEDLTALQECWHGRGPLTVCVSASCLVDTGWAERWMPAITATGPVFILVDVEPDRFVPAWARDGLDVVAIGLHVNDTAGQRTALLFSIDPDALWWLVVADDVTIRLMAEYLRGVLGPHLRTGAEFSGSLREAATATITHLLATESFVSFDALGSAHAG
jgi:hypothetical protein